MSSDNGDGVTFVVRDKPQANVLQALLTLAIMIVVVMLLLSIVGIWIKLFWIGWVFAG